jgi:hypothetical protein
MNLMSKFEGENRKKKEKRKKKRKRRAGGYLYVAFQTDLSRRFEKHGHRVQLQ